MSSSKTPLQAVVGVICDCLADLSADEQARALEAARVTLGLRPAGQAVSAVAYQDAARLPIVQVEMVNDRPLVVSPPPARPGLNIVVVGRQGWQRPTQRQLPAPRDPVAQIQAVRSYVRSLR